MNLIQPDLILLPVISLVLWTLVMQGWLLAARIPAMRDARLVPNDARRPSDLAARLPEKSQWPADNYNHLLEQPTIFYAVALALAVAHLGDGFNLILAWCYVGSRVVHSIIQATLNEVMPRLCVFAFGTLCIFGLIVNGLTALI